MGHQGEMSINALFPKKDGKVSKWRALINFIDIQNDEFIIDENEFFEDYFGHTHFLLLPDKFKKFK
jgi:hypothetical protein